MSQVPLLRPPLTDHQGPDDGDGYGYGDDDGYRDGENVPGTAGQTHLPVLQAEPPTVSQARPLKAFLHSENETSAQ